MPVTEKTEAQWLREGWTPEEISTFSKIGLVLASTGADALNDTQLEMITAGASLLARSAGKNFTETERFLTNLVVSVIAAAGEN